jgi:hypothetical protein
LRSGASGTNQVPSLAYVVPHAHDSVGPIGLDRIDANRLVVRKLMPTECERVMGFPEGWTAVDVNGAVMEDSHRYKCIGNSMSVNVMRWIGRRLSRAESHAAGTSWRAAYIRRPARGSLWTAAGSI